MLHTRWVLVLACLYGSLVACLTYNRDDRLEYYGDENILEDVEKSNIYRDGTGMRFKRDIGEPSEYNWDWEQYKRSHVQTPPIHAAPSAKKIVQNGQRKTIIPLEGIVFAKIKNNRLVRPKLNSRLFAAGHKYKSKVPLKRARVGTLSRRFDLYPRWYSSSIPTLFGKHFARRYYKPFHSIPGRIQSVGGQTRHHIIGKHRKPHIRSGNVFHELPLSWMTGESRDGIPKQNRGESMYNYGGYDARNFDETKLEGMESDDSLVMNPQSASKGHHVGADTKSLPFLKDIPHEIMAELNPYEYTVVPERENVRRRHFQATRARPHPHNNLPHAPHVVGHIEGSRELDALPSHEGWADFHSLPHNHHHRHNKMNPCYRNPCLNHGHCHFNGGNFRCQCKQGFSGDICDRTRFSCHPNPCYNGGTCTVLQTGYFCTCLPGFRGHDCDGQNPCASNPCQNSGRCTDTADGYFCTCGKGYSGHSCGDEIQHADDQHEDDIIAEHSAHEQHELDHELENMNAHDQTHISAGLHPTIHVNDGLDGVHDAVRGIHEGMHDPTHGDLATLAEDGAIHVSNGWHVPTGDGVHSDTHGIDAADLPGDHVIGEAPTAHEAGISNHGLEDLVLGGTTIECPMGACLNGGNCVRASATRAICNCPAGHHGTRCETITHHGAAHGDHITSVTSLPANSIHSPLQQHANNIPFSADGCTLNCKNGGHCTKSIAGYGCSCAPNYSGDLCETMLPSTNGIHNDGVHTEPSHEVTASFAGFVCSPDVCKNGGTCVKSSTASVDSHMCNCPVGYGGVDCGSPDLCTPNPCENGAACVQEGEENYKCDCLNGFKGMDCHLANHCSKESCKNSGICEETADSYHCKCNAGYRGIDCGLTDPCSAEPCENGGACDRAGTAFTCKCPSGFHGERCHLKAHCQPSPCNTHGECFESDEGFICECSPRFMGKFCEVKRHCFGSPCQAGYCTEGKETYDCKCPYGNFGRNCEFNVCDSRPCQNGGTCIPAENDVGYGCECVFPYHGATCGEMDPCLTNPCRNGGSCQSQLQGGLLTSLSHMSVFGPYDCGPYDTDSHCGGAMLNHHHEPYHDHDHDHDHEHEHEHHEEDHDLSYPQEAGGITHVPDGHKNGYGNSAFDKDKDMSRLDKDKESSVFDKEKDMSLIDDDKNMGGFDTDKDARFDKSSAKGYFDAAKDVSKNRYQAYKDGDTKSKNSPSYFSADKDRASKDMGGTEVDRDARVSSFASSGKGGHADPADRDGALDDGDGGKSNWLTEAKNDHTGLMDKVDYYPKHKNEGSDITASADLPDCPCNPQPCMWPPTCKPQQCTPPCKRHFNTHMYGPSMNFDENEQLHFTDTYHKRTIKSHNRSLDVQGSRRTLPRRSSKNIYSKKWNAPHTHHNKTVVRRDTDDDTDDDDTDDHDNDDLTKMSTKDILALKRDTIVDVKASKRLEIIPKVIINFRHPGERDVYKRTMHELYVCQCPPGFLGAHCQHMNPCRATPCTNGGSCIPRGDRYVCQCLPGYGGRHCDDPHPCTPNPCTHSGRCHLAKSVRGYECRCKNGWRGFNCEDKDNCALSNPCRHDGTCINADGAEGGVECKCRTRYSGKHCEVDTCAACDMNAYCHHGNCVCEAGYFGNGFRCKAMTDICTPNPCDNKGECKPGLDGKLFTCECQSGYVGTRCELPHPCANNPCLHNGACVDESNSKDRGILLLDRNDYKCFCSAGYKGKNCGETSLAACSSGPCQHNGTCFDSSSETHSKHLTHSEDYECFCALDFTGKNCEINHYACYSYPCMNGGTCLDAESLPDINFDAHGYKCNCNHGFIGRNCEVTVYGPGACHQSPCLNNGRCVDAMNSNDPDIHFDYEHQFKCICPPQYSGKICEVPYPACFSNPCHNKGICSDRTKDPNGVFDETGYMCTCMAGYDGRNCERQNSLAIIDNPDSDGHDVSLEMKGDTKTDEDLHENIKTFEGKKDDDDDSDVLEKGHRFLKNTNRLLQNAKDSSDIHAALKDKEADDDRIESKVDYPAHSFEVNSDPHRGDAPGPYKTVDYKHDGHPHIRDKDGTDNHDDAPQKQNPQKGHDDHASDTMQQKTHNSPAHASHEPSHPISGDKSSTVVGVSSPQAFAWGEGRSGIDYGDARRADVRSNLVSGSGRKPVEQDEVRSLNDMPTKTPNKVEQGEVRSLSDEPTETPDKVEQDDVQSLNDVPKVTSNKVEQGDGESLNDVPTKASNKVEEGDVRSLNDVPTETSNKVEQGDVRSLNDVSTETSSKVEEGDVPSLNDVPSKTSNKVEQGDIRSLNDVSTETSNKVEEGDVPSLNDVPTKTSNKVEHGDVRSLNDVPTETSKKVERGDVRSLNDVLTKTPNKVQQGEVRSLNDITTKTSALLAKKHFKLPVSYKKWSMLYKQASNKYPKYSPTEIKSMLAYYLRKNDASHATSNFNGTLDYSSSLLKHRNFGSRQSIPQIKYYWSRYAHRHGMVKAGIPYHGMVNARIPYHGMVKPRIPYHGMVKARIPYHGMVKARIPYQIHHIRYTKSPYISPQLPIKKSTTTEFQFKRLNAYRKRQKVLHTLHVGNAMKLYQTNPYLRSLYTQHLNNRINTRPMAPIYNMLYNQHLLKGDSNIETSHNVRSPIKYRKVGSLLLPLHTRRSGLNLRRGGFNPRRSGFNPRRSGLNPRRTGLNPMIGQSILA